MPATATIADITIDSFPETYINVMFKTDSLIENVVGSYFFAHTFDGVIDLN